MSLPECNFTPAGIAAIRKLNSDMRIFFIRALPLCLTALAGCSGGPQPTSTTTEVRRPGARPDGSVLLPNQWSLRPAGRQIELGDFPANIAMHPNGRFAAVLHCGYGTQEVVTVALPKGVVIARTNIAESFYGIAFSPDGEKLFCSGAGAEVVHEFSFKEGSLSAHLEVPLRDAAIRSVPAGLAVAGDGRSLFVAELWGHRVTQVDLASGARPSEISLLPGNATNATTLIPPPPDADLAAATKRGTALLDATTASDPFPYACVLDEPRQRLYVSLWAHASIAVIDLRSRSVAAHWPTQEHPNEMLLSKSGKHLFVANANRNTVSVLSTDTGKILETLVGALYANAPSGSTPNSLALTPDEKTLFVANADNNNVAVFDVATPGKSHPLGFIPVGWYPTSVRVTPDGKQLLVANGKGGGSRANPRGPQPRVEPPKTIHEYIGDLFRGTLSVIDLPAGTKFDTQMKIWTERAMECSPLRAANAIAARRPANSPIPARVGGRSPIKYCIYVIKENRTYDQVLGDLPVGNGDPSLCLFPEKVTPNHHQLAREFVLLDNFYVDGEVSADGHEWTMGAYATDFVEKSWPLSYGHNSHGKFPYPSEGKFAIAQPSSGYLWDRARAAGVSYRSYGEFVSNGATTNDPPVTRIAALQGHFDPGYRCWDMEYPDVKRAERFLSELARFEREGDMPRLQILRLPNDHTYGTSAGKHTPTAMVAENDLAFGKLIEGITRSKFWAQTAVFVVEDDAQNGPNHVDAHRSIAFAISPYVRRGSVDSTMYSTSSMLRTMELILGLKPMTQFDAAATPMFNAFQPTPDLHAYIAQPAQVDLEERNLKTAWGNELSGRMDFSKEDAADDLQLNEVIWRSVRGPQSPMPPPTRAAFVLNRGDDDD
ncbi:MAG: SMP-30/gluconolactonase/LRE family protein [Verrucomicrobia bacterium]|nr:SMP-30/gluconolactonase/LRE family protein [Verrucomicrobiota bacterium]